MTFISDEKNTPEVDIQTWGGRVCVFFQPFLRPLAGMEN
jgi:hypothetical protein